MAPPLPRPAHRAAPLLLAPAVASSADAATPQGFFGVMVNGPLDDPAVDLDAAGGDA